MQGMTRKAQTSQTALKDAPAREDYAALLEAVGQKQDRTAFIAVFEYFAPRVKSFLMKAGVSEENADELAQETMLTVWDRAGSYDRSKAAASTWIFTIARNKRIDALRKAGQMRTSDIDDLPVADDAPSAGAVLSEAEEARILTEALETLPPEQADLIRKSFFEDMTHADIALETGLPLGTVKSRIRLALERLRGATNIKGLWP